MAEEGLDGTDVGAALEEMGGERMAEGMTGGTFGDGRFADGIGELSLEGVFMEVIASVVAGPRMRAEFGGREDEWPGPFMRGIGVFAGEGFGPVGFADAGGEVLAVCVTEGGEVGLEAGFEGFGEGDEAVLAAFGVVNGDGGGADARYSSSSSSSSSSSIPPILSTPVQATGAGPGCAGVWLFARVRTCRAGRPVGGPMVVRSMG